MKSIRSKKKVCLKNQNACTSSERRKNSFSIEVSEMSTSPSRSRTAKKISSWSPSAEDAAYEKK